ncbi:glycosyltransferase [Candidatus Curtissbacteria bacterium]|nr:glycosyltransferase [Candidatus Curtissbacteria bacterium]
MKKLSKQPLVSVIMPVYNAGNFVSEAIESILSQTYKNFEFIIVDDASTDSSWEIISGYKKRYPQKIKAFKLVYNLNMGGDAAANIGFRFAKGEFVARMDADDISKIDRLEEEVKFLLSHLDIAVVGSQADVINAEGVVIGEKKVPTSSKEIYRDFFVFHPMIHSSVMIRRFAIRNSNGLYTLSYNANNDYLTFFKMISQGSKFANLKEKLLYYRIHGQNDSLIHIKRSFDNTLKIRLKAISEFGYKPSLLAFTKLMVQVFLMILLPEKFIVPLYMVVRGIVRPEFYAPFLGEGAFVRLKKALVPALNERLF